MAVITNTSGRVIRNVALPVEHGGWAFLLEPMLLGLLLAPSIAGLLLCVSGLGIFLLYQPTQIAAKDWLKGKSYPRTVWAKRFVALYGLLSAGSLLLATVTAKAPFWVAILLALPFAGLQMMFVLRGGARQAITEISGAAALSALTPAIVLAGGGALPLALAFWLVPVTRVFTSILYIRARLRRARGEVVNAALPLVAQIAGLITLGGLWLARLLPITAPLGMVILTGRAVHGLYLARITTPTKQIGFQEIGFGLLMVVLVAAGHG